MELFTGYKMAYLLSLCRVKRLAQNLSYENECIESGVFWGSVTFIEYNPLAIHWKSSFHKDFVENFMGYLLKKKLKYIRHNLKEIIAKYWEAHLFCRTRYKSDWKKEKEKCHVVRYSKDNEDKFG